MKDTLIILRAYSPPLKEDCFSHNIKKLKELSDYDVIIGYDATGKPPLDESNVELPVVNFTAEDYHASGMVLVGENEGDWHPTMLPSNNPSRVIYYNPEIAQILIRKQLPEYKHYWYWESDVLFNGKYQYFFDRCRALDYDLLCCHLKRMPADEDKAKHYLESLKFKFNPDNAWTMFAPVFRTSDKMLLTLEEDYRQGNVGYVEPAVPTLALERGLKVADINSIELFYTPFSFNNRFRLYDWNGGAVHSKDNMLFHPIH